MEVIRICSKMGGIMLLIFYREKLIIILYGYR